LLDNTVGVVVQRGSAKWRARVIRNWLLILIYIADDLTKVLQITVSRGDVFHRNVRHGNGIAELFLKSAIPHRARLKIALAYLTDISIIIG